MNSFWKNKKVLITGHTGFKGSWLSLILNELGAKVTGYALEPSTNPCLFKLADLGEMFDSNIGDIRDFEQLTVCLQKADPEIVFHLAAQPIVRESYQTPKDTFETNAMGTVNLMEAVRLMTEDIGRRTETGGQRSEVRSQKFGIKTIVNVTTDKVYENIEGNSQFFKEDDKLGGHDPYAASKACSEIITASYSQSFFEENGVAVSTARGGNVVGGGDWGADRLLPDFFRAIEKHETFKIRNPQSIRPWQHVLDALNGYMCLAEKMYDNGIEYSGAWNIGPKSTEYKSVKQIVEQVISQWPKPVDCQFGNSGKEVHESSFLALDCSKATEKLAWKQQWNTEETVSKTVEWFYGYINGESAKELCLKQIEEFKQKKTKVTEN